MRKVQRCSVLVIVGVKWVLGEGINPITLTLPTRGRLGSAMIIIPLFTPCVCLLSVMKIDGAQN